MNNFIELKDEFTKITERVKTFLAKGNKFFVKLCVVLPVISLVLAGFTSCSLFNGKNPVIENDYKVNIVLAGHDNIFNIYSSTVTHVHVYYGTYDSVEELEGQTEMGTVSQLKPFTALYNGPYTLYVDYVKTEYQDEFYHYEITSNPEPITFSEENGKIVWHENRGYVINGLAYTFGQTLGFQYGQDYKALPIDNYSVEPLGNGMHTFKISATDNSGSHYYYMVFDVKGYQK